MMTQVDNTRWWWVRHAPVTHLQDYVYGDSDPPADVSDVSLFDSAARRLPADAVWIVTNLQRTQQTAQAIAQAGYALPEPLVESAFREQGFGDWHGRLHVERNAERTDDFIGIWNCGPDEIPPGGESFVDLMTRVSSAIDRLTEQYKGRDIVCVAHGGSIRAALAHALGLSPALALSFGIENVSLTQIERLHSESAAGLRWRVRSVSA
ncbi:MAG: alpha-ribazole phosphatase [Gammaproteobacteria bacterium]|jgi:alpha-ribazole phosphatase